MSSCVGILDDDEIWSYIDKQNCQQIEKLVSALKDDDKLQGTNTKDPECKPQFTHKVHLNAEFGQCHRKDDVDCSCSWDDNERKSNEGGHSAYCEKDQLESVTFQQSVQQSCDFQGKDVSGGIENDSKGDANLEKVNTYGQNPEQNEREGNEQESSVAYCEKEQLDMNKTTNDCKESSFYVKIHNRELVNKTENNESWGFSVANNEIAKVFHCESKRHIRQARRED
ncbi:hypothetical protein G9A89_015469 [Geosiphon pyriformis]|nr:hypothetical protein G9A89_015469 [Geosiphon pyriformis]